MAEQQASAVKLLKIAPVQGRFIPGVAARIAEVPESEALALVATGAFTLVASTKPAEPTAAKQSPEKE